MDARMLRIMQQQMSQSTSQRFKIGDKVQQKKSSPFYDQSVGEIGLVTDVNCGIWDYTVKWETGTERQYDDEMLKAAEDKPAAPTKPKKIDFTELDKLVIGKTAKDEMQAVIKQHGNATKLFDEWGLGETIKYGRGMTFMFYGPPGTGKTWGANCIAAAMGSELMVMSAAEIQSSEPGAANRNIQQAFKTAKESGKVLLLDECDSLITSRADLGMVLAGEVNTLLTEIEKYEGVVILTTNRIETMDEALERRISLIVEFPLPDYESRVAIWTKLMPTKMPVEKGVSARELAKRELSGGQIKNVILQAARLALGAEKEVVELVDFDAAIARIVKSKNLMGTSSRFRQGIIQDYGKRSNTTVDKKLEAFLEVDEHDTHNTEL